MTAPLTIRPTAVSDIPGIIRLCEAVYPGAPAWVPAQLESHLAEFAQGQCVCTDAAGQIVGMSASLIVLWDDYTFDTSWRDFTAAGTFSNHDSARGHTLYGAEVMVDPAWQGRGVGTLLYQERRKLVRDLGLWRIRAGARLRNYHEHAPSLSPRTYVDRVIRGEIRDATLSFQLRRGFRVLDVIGGYLRHDPQSLGYAAVIEWLNPDAPPPLA